MTTNVLASDSRSASQLLMPFVGGLILLCLVTHIIISLRGTTIDVVDMLIFVPVALYYAAFLHFKGLELRQIRFANFVSHALTFGVVNGSWALHAMVVLATTGALDPSWVGPNIAMPGIWSIGLTLHGLSSVASRGFDR